MSQRERTTAADHSARCVLSCSTTALPASFSVRLVANPTFADLNAHRCEVQCVCTVADAPPMERGVSNPIHNACRFGDTRNDEARTEEKPRRRGARGSRTRCRPCFCHAELIATASTSDAGSAVAHQVESRRTPRLSDTCTSDLEMLHFSIAVPSMGDGRAASRRRRTSSARVSSKRLRHGSSGVP